MLAAEKQNKAVGAALESWFSLDEDFQGRYVPELFNITSSALITANKVKSIVLPAKSPLDSDFASSVTSSTSNEFGSGGSSYGVGLLASP
jgi:hypothetical protein